jgi:hypothetical protein
LEQFMSKKTAEKTEEKAAGKEAGQSKGMTGLDAVLSQIRKEFGDGAIMRIPWTWPWAADFHGVGSLRFSDPSHRERRP